MRGIVIFAESRNPFNSPTVNQIKLKSSSNGDGIPDWWAGHYGFNPHDPTVATNDLDADGTNNLNEYLNGTDPNEIQAQIHFENLWATNTAWPGTIEIEAGQPEQMAVLVNDTNFPAASWETYSSNFTANLGSTDGVYVVSVGLRGHADDSVQTWISTRITLDRIPPWLVITNPVPGTISRPMIQLQGYCAEPLTSLCLDVSNATGLLTNQEGFVVSQTYDTNRNVITTNVFQCFDIDLTNGVNTITLRAADMAGNTTVTNFNHTLASDSVAPVITVRTPTSGMKLSGDTFNMDGWLDDFTATVTASVVDGGGTTNDYDAVVERNGRFWLDNMVLGSGTSVVTLTAKDFWGNSVSTNISVIKGSVQLSVDPIDTSTLAGPATTVYGTVDSGYTVWVNGIQAADAGGGYWEADSVPVTPGGTAVFDVTAYPVGETPITVAGARSQSAHPKRARPDH